MKKLFITLLMGFVTLSAFSQVNFRAVEGRIGVRGDIFGLGVGTTVGAGAFEFNPNLMFYLPKEGKFFTLNGDFHYNIDLGNEVHLVPMAGPAWLHASGYDRLALNIGCGVDYDFDPHWTAFAEAKYQVVINSGVGGQADKMLLGVGCKYRF